MWPSREQAWEVLNEYTKNPNLIKHALSVEAGMRAYAKRFGEDEEQWAVVGLIHDFEYEKYPDLGPEGHPFKGAELMRDMGWDDALIRAVQCHAPDLTDTKPETNMEKAIYAVDELTGLITATALVRPSKSLLDVKVKSVKKKWKDKSFAAAVKREDIAEGAEMLGIEISEHISIVLEAMKGIAEELGLAVNVS
jgi:putative nucleotidyltransferase with HDIG domain